MSNSLDQCRERSCGRDTFWGQNKRFTRPFGSSDSLVGKYCSGIMYVGLKELSGNTCHLVINLFALFNSRRHVNEQINSAVITATI